MQRVNWFAGHLSASSDNAPVCSIFAFVRILFQAKFFSYRMAGKVVMLIKNSEKVRDHAESIEMINLLSTKDPWMIGMIWE